ncbi:MAG: YHS domain-containing protein [Alphaproteobacteria bacterium]|nr:YHS domain-containing protein [Alphaproteobacteria bacterium]
MKRTILALIASVAFAGTVMAGPQYVDKSGYAVSGFDVVAYFDLKQSPVGQVQPLAVPGKSAITAEYNGAKWAFSTEENRKKFLANPAKYAPVYDGHCAYGATQGGKVPANPHLWRIVDGKLYLNIKDTVVGFWEKDIPGNIKTGNEIWSSKLEPKPASERVIPNFESGKSAPL